MHPLIILILLVGVLFAVNWYKQASGKKQKEMRKKTLIGGAIVVVLLLLMTGRLNPIFAALAAAIPVGYRALGLLQTARNLGGAFGGFGGKGTSDSNGHRSGVSAEWLSMQLDHATGDMDGTVLKGAFKGRRLSALSLQELQSLHGYCRHEPQSCALLQAYLDRVYGDGWRDGVAGGAGSHDGGVVASGQMSRAQAAEVLGVAQDASHDQVIEAHRRLMQKFHPDRGGSNFIASQINRAKEALLA